MDARDRARVEAIGRLGVFGTNNAADWTPTKAANATPAQLNAQALFAQLNTAETGVIARLATLSAGQQSGAADFHGGVTSKSALRHGILEEMRSCNEAAAAIAHAQNKPEIMDDFRLPHGVSDEVLAARALSFADKAQAWEDEFIKLGKDDDFIQELKDRVTAFSQAKDDKGVGLQKQKGAGGGLDATIAEGLVVLHQLTVLLKNLYKNQPDKLAELVTATHVQRAPKRKKQDAPQPPSSPATSEKG
ncbi:MAG: hypothetical protein JO295_14205 [Verrucomicrobia bacterium]|nr:hypothetical protein [Verrucomicrobiota bacterium]